MEQMKIPCSSCDHQSDTGLAAFEHWRDTHKRIEGEELGPGLHKVGEQPWDYVYNPAEGQKVSAVGLDGHMYTGTITDVQQNKETGEMQLTVQQFDDGVGYPNKEPEKQ
jgi:hypothetical protein